MPMTEADIDERLRFAESVIRRAGQLALSYYGDLGSLDIRQKGPQDLVSEADVTTEALIRTAVAAHFPGDHFVGEESGGAGMGADAPTWVVDPIDGTQPFLLELPTWCVSIAFVADGRTRLGLVLNPVTDELFAARDGCGATLNGRPITVRPATTLADGLTTVGCSSRADPPTVAGAILRLLTAGGVYHRTGSGAISLCYVACGRMIGYVEARIHSWDCLAALLVVNEAGGRSTDFLGTHGVAGSGRLVAGSPGVFAALEDVLPA
jgi:myo-inositol-1(or 4)-monophosphatase